MNDKGGLQPVFLGVGKTEVSENIARALGVGGQGLFRVTRQASAMLISFDGVIRPFA